MNDFIGDDIGDEIDYEYDNFFDPSDEALDVYDELKLCEVCGDCYAYPGSICDRCERQNMIDLS